MIYCGDSAQVLKTFEANSIDLTVTSPPYDKLRKYNGYTFDFKTIAQELFRITKQGGVVVWVVGDETIKGSESGTSFKQALYFKEIGFNLHDTMIYEKNNFSNPSINRYHQIFEFMFVFSKGKPKTFNPIKDRKNIYAGTTNWGENKTRQKDGSFKERKKKIYTEFGMRFNIWRYVTSKGFATKDSFAYEHPAVFPEQLAYDHILTWTNENDIVLDPMAGSGTVPKMAKGLNRQWIAIDCSLEYCDLIKRRLKCGDITEVNQK